MFHFPGPAVKTAPNPGDILQWNGSEWVAVSGSGGGYVTQSAWFVDEQDISGNADDNNTGDTAGAPLATMDELVRRIGSPASIFEQNTTITLLSSCNASSVTALSGRIAPGFLFRLTGVATTLATLTSAAAQNIVVGSDRPYVQLGASWDPALVGRRCRVTASTGATQIGTVFWLEEIDGVDDTICYIGAQPYFSVPGAFGGVQALEAGGGDTFVVESLPSAGLLNVDINWSQLNSFYPQVVIDNVSGVDVATSIGTIGANVSSSVAVYGCDLNYNVLLVGGNTFEGCKIGGSQADNEFHSLGTGCFPVACSFQRTGGRGFVRMYGAIELFNNCSFAHTRAVLGSNSIFGSPSTYIHAVSGVSTWDWVGDAWQLEPNTQVLFESVAWGTSTGAASRGVRVNTGSFAQYVTLPTLAGTSTEVNVGGATGTFAGVLPFINSINNAAFVAHA